MSTETSEPSERRSAMRCGECDARLAHDQRYCVACGARRGPLPAEISALIGAIHEQGPAPVLEPGTRLADSVIDNTSVPTRWGFTIPGPRAASVAVMAMLAFGVIVGSLVGGTQVATLANAPLVIVGLGHTATTPKVVVVTSPSSGGGGGSPAVAANAPTTLASAPAAASSGSSDNSLSASSGTDTSTSTSTAGLNGQPPVKHVFMIVLSDRGFSQSFGSSDSGYLSGALRRQGELLQNYYAVASGPLANEIALISGQGPTVQTANDCPVFQKIRPAKQGSRGQVLGTGCVYPAKTKTLASQLTAAGDTWKAYLQGVSSSSKSACRVPKLGSRQAQAATAHQSYVGWRNPFVYFHSLTAGASAGCHKDEVGISHLPTDLKSESTTPSLSYMIAAQCSDGSEQPCKPNGQAGLTATNRFLKTVVPEIKRSAAYKDDGLIAITFDMAPQTGPDADPTACCNSPTTYPNFRNLAPGTVTTPQTTPTTTAAPTTTDTTTTTTAPAVSLGSGETTPTGGGGQVGLLLISPYVKKNSTDVVDYFNHFSLLATLEEMFGLHKLGYAGAPGLYPFGPGVFNNYSG